MTAFFLVFRERDCDVLLMKSRLSCIYTRIKGPWLHLPKQYRIWPFESANWRCKVYYRKNGEVTGEVANIKSAIRFAQMLSETRFNNKKRRSLASYRAITSKSSVVSTFLVGCLTALFVRNVDCGTRLTGKDLISWFRRTSIARHSRVWSSMSVNIRNTLPS